MMAHRVFLAVIFLKIIGYIFCSCGFLRSVLGVKGIIIGRGQNVTNG